MGVTGAETFLSSADAYERHVGRYGAQLAAALIDFAGAEPGARARRWCREGELAELWQAVGLRDVEFQPIVVRAGYTGFGDLWSPFPQGVAPSGAFCKALSEHERVALHDVYRRRLGVRDGPFELTARAWGVTGRVG